MIKIDKNISLKELRRKFPRTDQSCFFIDGQHRRDIAADIFIGKTPTLLQGMLVAWYNGENETIRARKKEYYGHY